MEKEYLPLGSVVMLKGIDDMAFCIVGYNYKKDGMTSDYCCTFFPWGIDNKMLFPVNIDDISGVCFTGYIDKDIARTIGELKELSTRKNS